MPCSRKRQLCVQAEPTTDSSPLIAKRRKLEKQQRHRTLSRFWDNDDFITKAKPDFYDGSRPAEFKKQIREELGPYIVPSTNIVAPCLLNFFTKAKGPKGTTDVCKLQALYDGALGARGIHELRLYIGQETLFDNNTYTITSTYHHSGLLIMYTTHLTASESPTNSIEYRMTQLRSFALTDASDTF